VTHICLARRGLAPAGLVFLVSLVSACQPNDSGARAPQPDPVKRGEYLVQIAACHDCHTPMQMGPNGPVPDMTRMLSGHPESMKMPATPPLPEPWLWGGRRHEHRLCRPLGRDLFD
jgi:mono/diheme cytochrome c family protein